MAFNPVCPFCGAEELEGDVQVLYTQVRLRFAGPDLTYANVDTHEVTQARCCECGMDVPVSHYQEGDDGAKSEEPRDGADAGSDAGV